MEDLWPDLAPTLQRLYSETPAGTALEKLAGDASTRSYYRLRIGGSGPQYGGPSSAIVMRLPPDALGSDELGSGEAAAELPFINMQRMLSSRGVDVPAIVGDDVARRVLLLEDLGDETLERGLAAADRSRWPALYGRAVDSLVHMHRACAEPLTGCIAYGRRFDNTLLRWELDHFREWGLEETQGTLQPADRAELDRLFEGLASAVAAQPSGFVHRDYQSRNLMLVRGRLVIIDFQDALLGPVPYDLVALLCDSYVDVDPSLQDEMIARYAEAMALQETAFRHAFWQVAAQRKLKDAGRFVYIDRARGNPDFLRWYPRSLVYVGRALEALPALAPLAEILERVLPGFPDAVSVPPTRTGKLT